MYQIPPKAKDAKQRMVRVTDPAEIEAIKRCGLKDPIGAQMGEDWYAEAHSLAQHRKQDVGIEV
jgi:hypothetical protein